MQKRESGIMWDQQGLLLYAYSDSKKSEDVIFYILSDDLPSALC